MQELNVDLNNLMHSVRVVYMSRLMVLCIVVGCSKRSGRDKDVSFFRIPTIISHIHAHRTGN